MMRIIRAIALILVALPVQAALQNQLQGHPSPYLAMHGDDPVQWQEWGPEVLVKAKTENKMIYISSGYFACHWCHVMQQESYKNPEVASLLNRYFIPVKIDRELQPALDAHLIAFVTHTRGSAGWPLNVFLTSEGYPLVGLTYSPTRPFIGLLKRVERLWRADPEKLKQMARRASLALTQETAEQKPAQSVDPARLRTLLIKASLSLGDEMEGGFGRQSRFPMAPQWSVLLGVLGSDPNPELRSFAELTLQQMATQGMRDHLGGGFFRYTVDPGWQIPHFEKMLYTQAQLARLYLQAARVFDRPEYRAVARETLDFALSGLRGERGGFIASLSAVDPQGEEGGGYLWHPSQLEQVLNAQELSFARKRWQLQGTPANEGGYLPVDGESLEQISRETGESLDALRQLEQQTRSKLLKSRTPRNHPRDVKQLAAWNGLMLSALVDGAATLEEERYRQAASALRDYLVTRLWNGESLYRARAPEGPIGTAALEDYVYVAVALNDWARLSGSQADRKLSLRLARAAWKKFYRQRGWQSAEALLIPGIATEPAISDGPLPSPPAMLIDLSFQLGDPEMQRQAREAMGVAAAMVSENPIWYATQARNLLRVPKPESVAESQ
jgi:uncharacterized protein YyaL (SSP411 family)